MIKKWKIGISIFCLLMSGCAKVKGPKENRFVSQVQVQLTRDGQTKKWTFSQPQKMEVVLYYLRSLDKKTPALSDPTRFKGDLYRIDLSYTDGTKRRIYQRADQFLSESFGSWQKIEQNKAELLYPLLKTMTSD